MEPIVRMIDLYKIYDNYGVETAIIKGISYNIFESDKIILIGPSGSGKTTLVNMLAGFQTPSAGQIFWRTAKKEITKINRNKLSIIRRNFMGFIDNGNVLLPQLNIKENILLSAFLTNKTKNSITDHYDNLVKILGIKHLLKKKPNIISQGEKKRVNIAAALINEPKILIADEPIEGIDPVIGAEILDLFEVINEKLGTAFLMTTHDQSVADRGKRIIELRNGVLYGAHERGLELNKLDRTRGLVVDADGRIQFSPEILSHLGNPKVIYPKITGDYVEIHTKTGISELEKQISKFECFKCNSIESDKFCKTCGEPTISIN